MTGYLLSPAAQTDLGQIWEYTAELVRQRWSMPGTLLSLAKQPLHMTPGEIRVLAVAGASTACIGGFVAAAISDYWSRRTVMLLGVATINFFTLLIPLVQSGEQLIIVRPWRGSQPTHRMPQPTQPSSRIAASSASSCPPWLASTDAISER